MERPQSIDFLQIRSAPESINATVDFIRLHARPFFRSLGLIVVLPFIALQLASFFFVMYGPADLARVLTYGQRYGTDAISSSAIYLGFANLLGTAVVLVLMIGVVYAYVRLAQNPEREEIAIGDVWREALKSFWRIFWSAIGLAIVFLVVFVVLLFIVGFLGRIFTEGGSEASVLLVLLFFVPAFIYVLASWSLFFPVRLIEEEAFFDSLGRSQSLVRDRRWKTFGFILGLGALLIVLQLSFRLPLTIIEFLLEMNVLSNHDLSELWYSITAGIAMVLASAGSIVCYAAMTLAVIFFYYSQIERTDALSLNLAISRIGVPNNPPSAYVAAGRHSPVADIAASGTIASGGPGTNANDDADTMPEAPVA